VTSTKPHARCGEWFRAPSSPTVRAGSGVSAAEESEEATRAMRWPRRAVGTGYRNANEVRIESALDPLRPRDDFRLIMMDLAFPAEPFAPTQPIP
jgi:hypothetical protein